MLVAAREREFLLDWVLFELFRLVFFSERRRHFQGLWCFPDGGDFQLLRPDQTLRPKRTTIEAPRAVAAQKKRLTRGAAVVEIIAADDAVVGPGKAAPPSLPLPLDVHDTRPSRLSRFPDRRQAAPPGRGSAYAPARSAVRRLLGFGKRSPNPWQKVAAAPSSNGDY